MVGSFDSLFIVFHSLRLLCVILILRDDFRPPLFFSSVILSISLFQIFMVPRQKGCLNSCSCMLHTDILISQFDWERIMFDILLVCVF